MRAGSFLFKAEGGKPRATAGLSSSATRDAVPRCPAQPGTAGQASSGTRKPALLDKPAVAQMYPDLIGFVEPLGWQAVDRRECFVLSRRIRQMIPGTRPFPVHSPVGESPAERVVVQIVDCGHRRGW